MKHIRILQIGDIHFPTAAASRLVDRRDQRVGGNLVDAASANPIQKVMRELIQLCQADETAKLLLLCGDLTSCGDIRGYKDCVKYLRSTIGDGAPKAWKCDLVHVVPGNHDVDRSLCDPHSKDLYAKFRPLEEVWDSIGFPVLASRTIRETTLSHDGCKVTVFSLNSCIGCGEWRSVPNEVKAFHRLLDRITRGLSNERAFTLKGEQLDTPAFDEGHLSDIERKIQQLDRFTVPIVMAHHNILAQALPRIDVYAEAINSGLARSRLSNLNLATIYCHGHIHSDPIELVNSGTRKEGVLISVSVPEFARGFNVLDIEFNSANVPLGCIVRPYRRADDGSVKAKIGGGVRIGLKPLHEAVRICDKKLAAVMAQLKCQEYQRFPQIVESVRQTQGTRVQGATIARMLREAEWFGLVDILNRDEECTYWQVQRVTP